MTEPKIKAMSSFALPHVVLDTFPFLSIHWTSMWSILYVHGSKIT